MSKLKVHSFGVSLDGYGAGPGQDLANPLGVGGRALHEWVFGTRGFQRMIGDREDRGTTGVENDFFEAGFENIGASILGRNMFGPVRGPWLDEDWKGWWGDEPPYRTPVFVLTHHAREPLVMKGGTTFYFVTEGIEKALELARVAAGDKDVRLGGGVATIRQYLKAGLVDALHLAYSPVFLGKGENLLDGIDLPGLGYGVTESVLGMNSLHVRIERVQRNQALRRRFLDSLGVVGDA